jgi:two-component system response regulator YesN
MNILIVDDEPKIINGMHNLIEEHFQYLHHVYSVDDSAEALKLIDKFEFDLAFIDLMMPGYTGFDLIEALRSKDLHTYIVILSGYSYFSYAQQAIDLGVQKYLTKPTDPDEIISIVEEVEKNNPETTTFCQYYKGKNPIILSCLNYISRNYMHKITLEDIANNLFTSSTYISQLFKKETGKNISDFIIDFRLDKAKYYLQETDTQISAISELIGYQDAGYFSSSFKKKYGITPLEYRNRNTKQEAELE